MKDEDEEEDENEERGRRREVKTEDEDDGRRQRRGTKMRDEDDEEDESKERGRRRGLKMEVENEEEDDDRGRGRARALKTKNECKDEKTRSEERRGSRVENMKEDEDNLGDEDEDEEEDKDDNKGEDEDEVEDENKGKGGAGEESEDEEEEIGKTVSTFKKLKIGFIDKQTSGKRGMDPSIASDTASDAVIASFEDLTLTPFDEKSLMINAIENEDWCLHDKHGHVRTIHEVDENIRNMAFKSCTQSDAERIAAAKYVLMNSTRTPIVESPNISESSDITSTANPALKNELVGQVSHKNVGTHPATIFQSLPITNLTLPTPSTQECYPNSPVSNYDSEVERRPPELPSTECEMNIEGANVEPVDMREEMTFSHENINENDSGERKHTGRTENNDRKSKPKTKLTVKIGKKKGDKLKKKTLTKQSAKKNIMSSLKSILDETNNKSECFITHDDTEDIQIDKEINYVVCMNENGSNDAGLNTLIDLGDRIEICRNYEILPIDDLQWLGPCIKDFNEESIPDSITDAYLDIDEAEDTPTMEVDAEDQLHPILQPAEEVNVIENFGDSNIKDMANAVRAKQLSCPETKEIIEIVKRELIPTHVETKSKSQFTQTLAKNLELLLVEDDVLKYKYHDLYGNIISLLVVPPSLATEIVENMHKYLSHMAARKLEPEIMKHFYIANLKKHTRELECVPCTLAQAPKLGKGRAISVKSSIPGRVYHADLLTLISARHNGVSYNYVLTIVDTATNYLLAAPLRTKSSNEVATACMTLFWNASAVPAEICSDAGSEFMNRKFQSLLGAHGINFRVIDKQNKDANLSENSNFRITSGFRKSLEDSTDWPEKLSRLVYALNNSLCAFGCKSYTPAYLFSKRANMTNIPQDNDAEFSINQTIKEINHDRFKDHLSLLQAVDARKTFAKDQLCLVLREHAIAALGLKTKVRKFKLEVYWTVAKVVSIISNDMLIVKFADNSLRKLHKRQVKSLPQNQHEKLLEAYNNRASLLKT